MGFFATRGRAETPAGSGPAQVLTAQQRMGLPPRFEVVGDALVAGADPLDACREVGRDLARDGASLEEALEALRDTWRLVAAADPDLDAVAAFLGSWSETTLSFVHHISCEDPMTGLASLAHLRSSISALFRGHVQGEGHPRDTHALVVVDLPYDRHGFRHRVNGDSITRALRVARLGETARTVFPGSDVIGRLSTNRIVVLAERESRLGVRVRLLRRLIEGLDVGTQEVRVWIEGLPATDLSAGLLLDELARP